jgi:hypothetical protein
LHNIPIASRRARGIFTIRTSDATQLSDLSKSPLSFAAENAPKERSRRLSDESEREREVEAMFDRKQDDIKI